MVDLKEGLAAMTPLMVASEGKGLTAEQATALAEKAAMLSHIVTDPMNK